ncbi:MAG: hypothetical protein KAV82_10495, partial [Phycisphaerae bacterium]|nr:hypothetical protein [Phycisphaerae bacterium]
PYVCQDTDTDGCDDCSQTGGPPDPANDGTDTDSNGVCDAGDPDDDGDGVPDGDDSHPLDPYQCRDVDGDTCDDCSSGTDDPSNDGTDTDGDGLCDSGDTDDDNDGVLDGDDTDPLAPYVCQDTDADGCDDCSQTGGPPDPANDGTDTDSNGICDTGDPDDDGDGVPDGDDSHPLDPYQCRDVDGDTCDDCSSGTDDPSNDGTDTDGDGLCDAGDTDDDNDGVLDGDDTDPLDPYVCQDTDTDGCDDCSQTGGPPDPANDGTDTDSDGLCDDGDNCPNHSNPDQADCDSDGVGDVCAIATGFREDCNSNGIPDECEPAFGHILLRTGAEPEALCVDTDDTFTVTLDVSNLAQPINGVQALIQYDPVYLVLDSIAPEPGWQLIAPDGADPDPDGDGNLVCTLSLPSGEMSTNGTVATLMFDPIAQGVTNVTFQGDNDPLFTELDRAADATTILPDKFDSGTISIDDTVATAASNSPVCEGDTIELYGGSSGGAQAPYTYLWAGPDSFSSTDQNPTISDATLSMTGTYYLTVTNTDGCEFTTQADVTVELCMVVNVEIEGLIGDSGSYGPPSGDGSEIDREVTFVFTDCDGAAETFVVPVTFTADTGNNKGVGSMRLTGLDAGFEWLGVQEGHTLRTLVAVDFVSMLADSVTVLLRSGDFHTAIVPQNNLIDITDFSIWASNWETVIGADQSIGADASGDGYHDSDDFAIIQPNFFNVGDAVDGCSRVGRVPPAALQVGVVSRTPRASIAVSELSLTVAHAERADLDGNGVIDARDIRAFARRHNLPLQPAFDAKLLELEAELIELEPAVDSELEFAPRRVR